MHAVDGKMTSGVVVATTMRSTSAAGIPAAASAARAALSRPDPRVARVDALLEIAVGDDLRRQVAARSRDAAMHR